MRNLKTAYEQLRAHLDACEGCKIGWDNFSPPLMCGRGRSRIRRVMLAFCSTAVVLRAAGIATVPIPNWFLRHEVAK